MEIARKFAGLLALGAICLVSVLVQGEVKGDVRIVSSFVAPGEPVPAQCISEAKVFAQAVTRYPQPEGWHWVLICDEAGWRRFLDLSGRPGEYAIYASTDLEGRTTYLRGDKLLHSIDLRAKPEEIMAHELAHIRLHAEDEHDAQKLGQYWLRATNGGRRGQ